MIWYRVPLIFIESRQQILLKETHFDKNIK